MAIHSPAMDTSPRIYDVVMAAFDSKRITQRTISDESGVPFSTVCKIAQRNVKDPSVHTVQRLYDYFAVQPLVAYLFDTDSVAGGLVSFEVTTTASVECASGDPRHGIERRGPEKRKRIDRRIGDA